MDSLTHIVSVAVPRPLAQLYTYGLSAEEAAQVQVGGWVEVLFGKSRLHAFVVEAPRSISELPPSIPRAKLKKIQSIGAQGKVIPDDVLKLAKWAQDYYRAPLGEILNAAVPAATLGLRSQKQNARPWKPETPTLAGEVALTEEQRLAIDLLENAPVSLLHGVTGSGKTEVYLELARRALKRGKGVLILVPEIALTPQLHGRFEAGLGEQVGLWHSALADGQRRDQASALLRGDLRVVVGARSAVFAPIRDLGLIVVDEEHDPTYKQEDRVRYHARDLCVVRGKSTGARVVLGSATPSLETLERVREGKYSVAHLKQRVAGGALPQIEIISLTETPRIEGIQAILTEPALEEIRARLDAGEQVMIFLNRRGFAAFLLCEDCGEVPGCPNCSISLTVHRKSGVLRCHHCDHREPLPDTCPKCASIELKPMGAGTESLEEELPALLPQARMLRLDRDQITSATRLEKALDLFRSGGANVLLGTQMLVKGHDFPKVTLVVVLLADALFRWPDFRAQERALQTLTQVSGRAGRSSLPGKVLIQTFQPDHAVLQVLQGILPVEQFLGEERELREALSYPPFGRLARLRFESEHSDHAQRHARRIADALSSSSTSDTVQVLGPSEAFMEKLKGKYRWDILLRSKQIGPLQEALRMAERLRSSEEIPFLVDVDPYGIS